MNAPLKSILTEADAAFAGTSAAINPADADLRGFMDEALDHMPFLVDQLFPIDVGALYGAGGEGKSTLLLWLVVCYVLGRPVLGRVPLISGSVLWISGEDPRRRFIYRLKKICLDEKLTPEEISTVESKIKYMDISSSPMPMAEKDAAGNMNTTQFANDFYEAFGGADVRWLIIDPLASFNPSEQSVNDGLQRVIVACRQLCEKFNAFVCIVHHLNKVAALNSSIDLESMRGGTALSGGVRFAMQILTHRKHGKVGDGLYVPREVSKEHFEGGGSVASMHVTKIQDAAMPAAPFWVARIGYTFELIKSEVRAHDPDAQAQAEVDERKEQVGIIARFLLKNSHTHYTRSVLRDMSKELAVFGKTKMPSKNVLNSVIERAIAEGDLLELPLPANEVKGQKKTYVYAQDGKF